MKKLLLLAISLIFVTGLSLVLPESQAAGTPSWMQLNPTGTPISPRYASGHAYDVVNDRLVIFSGAPSSNTTPKPNDVWVLVNASGANGAPSWVKLNPTGTPPQGRHISSMVYDQLSNRVIVYGGCQTYCGPFMDTWVLTNANGLGGQPTWIQLPNSPQPRDSHTAVYDPGSNRMIIFGGGQGPNKNDVWVLKDANGVGTPSWEQLTPAGTPPAPRSLASAVYDQVSNRMIIFGGYQFTPPSTNYINFNDVWVLTNANGLGGTPQWIQLSPTGVLPTARSTHGAVYDPTTNRMLIFFGRVNASASPETVFNDVWILNAANGLNGQPQWNSQIVPVPLPPARYWHAFGYAPSSNRLAITTGASGDQVVGLFNDTWVLNSAFSSVRTIWAGNAGAAPGSAVTVPLILASQGDENALGFSLTYDPAILSNPIVTLGADAGGASLNLNTNQTAQGRLGIAVALPATQKFTAGTRQIANVTFLVAAGAQATTTQIGFSDQPIPREVVSETAAILPASYTPGSVTVTPGYEADVSPRPNGNNNGAVTIADWVQVGRFAAGVDTLTAGSEFQRADCAPRETKGDGRVSIADWVQAGRYAAAVDPVVAAGGPTAPVSGLLAEDVQSPGFNRNLSDTTLPAEAGTTNSARVVRAVGASIEPGRNGILAIEVDAVGDENALGFSVNFDAAQLQFVSAALGGGAGGASLNVNAAQAANGRIGIGLALPTSQSFAAGKRQLVVITFAAKANASATETMVTLGDLPVGREVVDAAANTLTATWAAATVTLARSVASVSAASFNGEVLASEAIVAAFGGNLATATQIAATVPLPTSLAGTSVKVKDSVGVERLAALFFVAPTQVNYLVPAGTAAGEAVITITSGDGAVSIGKVRILNIAPGVFSADASGRGLSAATVLRVKADGTQSYESLSRYDAAQQRFVATPIDLGPESDQVFLIPYGTGWRNRSSLAAVTTRIGGQVVETLYAGPQGDFVGLDQLNLRLPRSLAGRGEVDVVLTVDGVSANVVRVSIK